MALPSTNFEQGQKLIEHVKQMTDVVNRLLFKTEQIATQGIDSIRVRQEAMNVKLGDLVAAAEIYVDEAGSEQAERVIDSGDDESPVVERLQAIENVLDSMAEPVEEIKAAVQVLASAEKEDAENVLKDGQAPGQKQKDSTGSKSPIDDIKDDIKEKAKIGILGALAFLPIVIKSYFLVWFKSMKFIFGGFITRISKFFGNIVKSVKSSKGFGVFANAIKMVKDFFITIGARLGAFFAPVVEFVQAALKKIRPVLAGIAGTFAKIAAILNPIGIAVIAVLGVFETIKGFIEGFTNTEGPFLLKAGMGVVEGIKGLIDFLIFEPISLLRDIIAWIGGMLGFEKFEEMLNGVDISFDGFLAGIKAAGISIINWLLDTLSGVGIPGFNIPMPFGFDPVEVPGFYPFSGVQKYKIEVPKPPTAEPVTVENEAVEGAMNDLKLTNDDFIKMEHPNFTEPVLVSKSVDEDGMHTIIAEDGGIQKFKDESGIVATAIEADAAKEEGGFFSRLGNLFGGGDSGEQIDQQTTDLNQARDEVTMGPGGSVSTSSAVDASRKSQTTLNTYYGGFTPSSLGMRVAQPNPR